MDAVFLVGLPTTSGTGKSGCNGFTVPTAPGLALLSLIRRPLSGSPQGVPSLPGKSEVPWATKDTKGSCIFYQQVG